MSIDFKKLRNFVKVLDTGSLSKASAALRIAQPALSQQLLALETYFNQKLVTRGNQGVKATDAGTALYAHAQAILRHLDRVHADVAAAGGGLSGRVSIGLATYTPVTSVSIPFLIEMKKRLPNIIVHLTDSFGPILSEFVMTGRMDMAIISGSEPIKGVHLEPLWTETLYFVGNLQDSSSRRADGAIELSALVDIPLVIPGKKHALRWAVDEGFARCRIQPTIVAEIESIDTLSAAVQAGLGCTILPRSIAHSLPPSAFRVAPLISPTLETSLSMCVSDHLPLSEAATATRKILLEILHKKIPAFKA